MSKKITFIVLCLFVSIISVQGQEDTKVQFGHIDKHVRKTPDSLTHSITKLHNYLVQPATNKKEMVRAFYMWIISNIKYKDQVELLYDPDLLFYIGSNNCSTPVCVLKKRSAVCEGFSHLFQYFCIQSGIECYSIGGYIIKNGALQDRATHSWNAAKIGEEWFFFDLSWANVIFHYTGIKSKTNEFFLVTPEKFILTHLPLIPMWQFLPNPVPLKVFNTSEDQITRYLNTAPKTYNFTDSLAQFIKLSSKKRILKTADEIYRVNPGNKFNLAIEYFRYSQNVLNYDGEIDIFQFHLLMKATKKLTKAIELFNASSDVYSKLMVLKSQDNLAIIQNRIQSANSNIIYLE